jgi:prephenate dehydrogenase
LIAFTSQLTHVLAVALMHADTFKETKEATGDSFRDLTRIAKINEVMWSELFLENKQALIDKINHFKDELDHVKDLIESNDKETLQTYLKIAKEKRKTFDVH